MQLAAATFPAALIRVVTVCLIHWKHLHNLTDAQCG